MRNLHVGTMGWSYDFWKDSFYPDELQSSEFLAYYSSKFDTVEVDNTFYRIPREQTVLSWADQTSDDFVFSLKFPRVITHVKMLRDCESETKVFLQRVGLFGKKLGPLLLQFPFSFRIEQIPILRRYLEILPSKHRYVVEIRNRQLLGDDLFSVLKDRGVALAWVDSVSMPLMTEVTADFIYIRWEGNRKKVNGTLGKLELNRMADVRSWVARLEPLLSRGMNIFGYFSKYYSGFPPSDVQELLKILVRNHKTAQKP